MLPRGRVLSSVCPGLTSAQVLAPEASYLLQKTVLDSSFLEEPLAIFSTQGQSWDNTARKAQDGW